MRYAIMMAMAVSCAVASGASQASEDKPIYHGESGNETSELVKCVVGKWEARGHGTVQVADLADGKKVTFKSTDKSKATAHLDIRTTDSVTNLDLLTTSWSDADPHVEDVRQCI